MKLRIKNLSELKQTSLINFRIKDYSRFGYKSFMDYSLFLKFVKTFHESQEELNVYNSKECYWIPEEPLFYYYASSISKLKEWCSKIIATQFELFSECFLNPFEGQYTIGPPYEFEIEWTGSGLYSILMDSTYIEVKSVESIITEFYPEKLKKSMSYLNFPTFCDALKHEHKIKSDIKEIWELVSSRDSKYYGLVIVASGQNITPKDIKEWGNGQIYGNMYPMSSWEPLDFYEWYMNNDVYDISRDNVYIITDFVWENYLDELNSDGIEEENI